MNSDYYPSRERKLEQKQEAQKQNAFQTDECVCPGCSASNEKEALYCQECGASLASTSHCPKCNAKTIPQADICESCGAWLLEDSCKFCYGKITPEDKYCPECGNPAGGITCPKCGLLSNFDFCSNCNTPLTSLADEQLLKLQADPEQVQMQKLCKEIQQAESEMKELGALAAEQPQLQSKEEEERELRRAMLRNIDSYIKTVDPKRREESKLQPPQKTSPSPKESLRDSLKTAQDTANRKNEIEKKKREAAEKLKGADSIKFPDPQNARRFFSATKPALPCRWHCNFADYIHPDPSNCARPDLGGRWIIDTMG